jgi:uncharacterized RmlC-like cupin family protein
MALGAHTGLHRYPHDYGIVSVNRRTHAPSGRGSESTAELTAGVAYFRPAGVQHDVINGGDQDLMNMIST